MQGAGCRVQVPGFRVQGSGFRVQGAGFRVQGSGFRGQGSGFRVQGSGFRGQVSGFRAQGSGFRIQGSGFRVQDSGRDEVVTGSTLCWIPPADQSKGGVNLLMEGKSSFEGASSTFQASRFSKKSTSGGGQFSRKLSESIFEAQTVTRTLSIMAACGREDVLVKFRGHFIISRF